MFSSKTHINLLTSALHAYGVEHVIVCAGARNGILVHNFKASGFFTLHGAVDERSAAFMALGMTLATGHPACVCVTSGSALLGCLPACAEACYRQIPLLVLSADRPAEWIDRLDGQTIHQVNALEPYATTWNIEEISQNPVEGLSPSSPTPSVCKALLREALSALNEKPGRPVHINVPISEPLFTLGEHALPVFERTGEEKSRSTNGIPVLPADKISHIPSEVIMRINAARLPILVIGQYEEAVRLPLEEIEAGGKLLVLPEFLANCRNSRRTALLEKLLCGASENEQAEDSELPRPDLIIHIGLNSVHKQLRTYWRSLRCPVIRISEDGDAIDTISASTFLSVQSPLPLALQQLGAQIKPHAEVRKWQARLDAQLRNQAETLSPFCMAQAERTPVECNENPVGMAQAERTVGIGKADMLSVVQTLSSFLRASSAPDGFVLHLANSSVVREACHVFDGGIYPIHCNRGTNGIEGSVSAAAGYAIATPERRSLLLTGDLSFLYDQNGLWSNELGGNLRIIVFNDGGGGIFHRMPALKNIPERNSYISAPHAYSAKGPAETFKLTYLSANAETDVAALLKQWWTMPSPRPVVLEFFMH